MSTAAPHYRVFGWSDAPLVAVALLALAAGFGQFGAVAALGNVAKTFGHLVHGATFADEAGLSGTVLGVGLAIIRAASLLGLPLASLADRFGRRPLLGATCAIGLALTVLTTVSPSFWWFVAIFAIGRPFLSAAVGLTQVSAVELTASHERAKAVAMMAAGYAVGAGLAAIIHSLAASALGFRGIFALAVVPLVFLPAILRKVVEPDRFARMAAEARASQPILGPVARPFRRRLLIVAALAFCVSVITGPANSLVFIYAQNFLHLSGIVTSVMVVCAGITGLGGLLVGRWLSDRVGRRPAVSVAMMGMALFGTLAYSGPEWALLCGYVAGVTCGALFAPAAGALANELFPTAVRASVTGWYIAAGVVGAVVGLLAFGGVADVRGTSDHVGLAAAVVFLPIILATGLLLLLPETKGKEPEELWPDSVRAERDGTVVASAQGAHETVVGERASGTAPAVSDGDTGVVSSRGRARTTGAPVRDGANASAGEDMDADPDPSEDDEDTEPGPVPERVSEEGGGATDADTPESPTAQGGSP